MDVVGDHAQPLVGAGQRLRHRLDGGADAHEQRGMVGDVFRDHVGDVRLFALQLALAREVILVLHAAAEGGATVIAAQQVGLAQLVDVAADGLRGNVQQAGELFNRHKAVFAHQLQNLVVSG
ncbi:hypothetical protein D3C72_1751020 [compost metagenome]